MKNFIAKSLKKVSILSLLVVVALVGLAVFTTNSASAASDGAVYRFFRASTGEHFYTASVAEKDMVTSRWGSLYAYEGVAWTRTEDPVSVYRFYNLTTGNHFFTANVAEKNNVIAKWPTLYQYEGVAWEDQLPGGPVIQRFLNLKTGSHFYTASETEKANVIAKWPTVYQYEGIAWGGEQQPAQSAQLTIADPNLTLTKPYDGNTTVASCAAGDLTGVVDDEDVTVTCVATYDNSAVGTDKTITVVYTLAGADAAKYVKPVDGLVETGAIVGVTDEAQLRVALAGSDTTIALGADITLTAPLDISRDVTIDGGISKFTLTRTTAPSDSFESYPIMVSAGKLTAINLGIVSDNTGEGNAVGITVQPNAELDLQDSTITAAAAYGLVYGVFAQGSNAITLTDNSFIFSGADATPAAHRIMLGVEGIASIVELSGNTITSTLHTAQEEIKLVVNAPSSTLAEIQAYAAGLVATGEKLRATASDAERTIYTRTTTGWTIMTEAQLRAALTDAGQTTITLANDITLTAPLNIDRTVTIDGGGKTISGNTITITAVNVALNNMTLTGTENLQAGDGNYGIMVQGGSLVVNSIHMIVATDNADNNVGFNVASGASLDLRNSLITITDAGGNQQQYAVYTQSGAGNVALTNNTFSFNAINSSGSYSYLIGAQGATVANYPNVTLTGTNTNNAYIKLLLVGADTLANKEGYAAAGNKVVVGERLGIIGTDQGIYYRLAGSWVK